MGKRKKVESKVLEEYASMCMVRLNSKVRQYGEFNPGKRVSAEPQNYRYLRYITRIFKIPYQNDPPAKQKQNALVKFRRSRKAFTRKFGRGFNLALSADSRGMRT